MPSPVMRMAPYPIRRTLRSSPILKSCFTKVSLFILNQFYFRMMRAALRKITAGLKNSSSVDPLPDPAQQQREPEDGQDDQYFPQQGVGGSEFYSLGITR